MKPCAFSRALPPLSLFFLLLFLSLLPLSWRSDAKRSESTATEPCDSARIAGLLKRSNDALRVNYNVAVSLGREALELAERCGSEQHRAAAHLALGWALRQQVPTDSTRTHFQRALEAARDLHDERMIISALRGLANLHSMDGRSASVRDGLDSVQAMAERLGDPSILADVHRTRGWIEYGCLRGEAALSHYARALELYRQAADSVGILRTVDESVMANIILGRYGVDNDCRTVLERAQVRGDSCTLLFAVNTMGIIMGNQGKRDSAARCFREAFDLADRCGAYRILAQSLMNLGMNRNRSSLPLEARPLLYRALALAENLRDSTLLRMISGALAAGYQMTGDADSCHAFHRRTVALLQAMGDSAYLAREYGEFSNSLYYFGKRDSARRVMQEAVACARAIEHVNALLLALLQQGLQEFNAGLYQTALRKYHECEKLLEGTDPNHFNRSSLHYHMAAAYSELHEWDKALEHYRRAADGFTMRKNFHSAAFTRIARARTFIERGKAIRKPGDLDSALVLLETLFVELRELKGDYMLCAAERLMGSALTEKGEVDRAMPHLRTALDMSRRLGDTDMVRLGMHAMGLALYRAGQHGAAIDTIKAAVAGYEREASPALFRGILHDLSTLCAEQGSYREALKYHRACGDIDDSLMRAEHMELLADMDARYESTLKQQRLALLENEQQMNRMRIENQQEELLRRAAEKRDNSRRIMLLSQAREIDRLQLDAQHQALRLERLENGKRQQENTFLRTQQVMQTSLLTRQTELSRALLFIVVLLLVLGFLLHRRFRDRRREAMLRIQAAEAEALQITAEKERKEKEMQRDMTRALFDTQERERQRIASDLHDSVGQQLVVIRNRAMLATEELAGSHKVNGNTAEIQRQLAQVIDMTGTAMHTIREITHDLRPSELDRLGLTSALRTIVQASAGTDGLTVAAELDIVDGLYPPSQEIMIYRMVQEGFCNILKHAHAHNARLRVKREYAFLELCIEDDGQGMLEPDPSGLSRDARGGLGLRSMRERAAILGGELSLQSRPGTGTVLRIRLPLPAIAVESQKGFKKEDHDA